MPRRHQVAALAAAAWALLVAARVLTAAPDPWEWDEILFTNAVRDGIDLRAMRPHAPGYPLFVMGGRALAAAGVEPFRAATLTGLAGGLLAPVALGALLVALEVPLAWATMGGALYAFVPSVWLHAVRPLSDSLAAAAFLASAAALVASSRRTDGRLLAAGAGFAGLCFGARPQTAVALLPFAAWSALHFARRGRSGSALASASLGLAVSALVTLPAVVGTGGLAPYRAVVAHQAAYVRAEDSLRLVDLAKADTWARWVRDPFGPDALAAAFLLLAACGALAEPRKALRLAAIFGPLVALTIPFSSLPAAPRYALVLLPFPAALAALALWRLARRSRPAAALAGAALVGASAAVGAPAVVEVATHTSPPVAACHALRDDPVLAGRPLVVWGGLQQHRKSFLPGRQAREVREDAIADVTARDLIVMADDAVFGQVPIRRFAFRSPLLERISRARYRNVSIVPGNPRVGILQPWLDGTGDFDSSTGDSRLEPGAVLTVRGPVGPVEVTVHAAATPRRATILRVMADGASRRVELVSGEERTIAFRASPNATHTLFRLAVEDGPVSLTGWRVRPGGSP